jgi:hypothetical protein
VATIVVHVATEDDLDFYRNLGRAMQSPATPVVLARICVPVFALMISPLTSQFRHFAAFRLACADNVIMIRGA